MTPVFKLHNVIKRYGTREVLNIQDLMVAGGGIYGILGPNGSGKTTLLRILALLTISDEGNLSILGQKLRWDKKQLVQLRRQMSMVTQTSFMFQGSVFYNVAYGLRARRLKETEIKKKVYASLELVGMQGFAQAEARTLSGGERQKVAIARALAVQPKIVLLDEPTSNIDAASAVEIENHIRFINQKYGTTIMLVTHNLFQARRLADEIIFLWEGKILEHNSCQAIFEKASDPRTAAFLRGETFF